MSESLSADWLEVFSKLSPDSVLNVAPSVVPQRMGLVGNDEQIKLLPSRMNSRAIRMVTENGTFQSAVQVQRHVRAGVEGTGLRVAYADIPRNAPCPFFAPKPAAVPAAYLKRGRFSARLDDRSLSHPHPSPVIRESLNRELP